MIHSQQIIIQLNILKILTYNPNKINRVPLDPIYPV